jgi:hypothetical protein
VDSDLRLRVLRQSRWQSIQLDERNASFEISIGNPRCAGDYLVSQIRWARSRFSSFTFSLGDMLNLYDYTVTGHPNLGRLDDAKAREVCSIEGDSWLRDNLSLIRSELSMHEFTVMRWEQWLSIPDVDENLAALWAIYHKNEAVRDIIRSDVDAYLHRRASRVNLIPPEWERLSSHLLEELAVYKYQTETSHAVNLYPGSNPVILRPISPVAEFLPAALRERHFVLFEIHPNHVPKISMKRKYS